MLSIPLPLLIFINVFHLLLKLSVIFHLLHYLAGRQVQSFLKTSIVYMFENNILDFLCIWWNTSSVISNDFPEPVWLESVDISVCITSLCISTIISSKCNISHCVLYKNFNFVQNPQN